MQQQIDERPRGGSWRDDRPSEGKHRVLLVDDDTDTLALGMEALLCDGWDVECATNGFDGLDLALHTPPDVVVCDLQMPRMSGRELCDAVRRAPSLAQTRILIVSGVLEARSIAAECAADGLVTKPFTAALLRHHVRRLLGV